MDIKKINWLTYASLLSLALGLFSSITFSALHHIFLAIPCFYFLRMSPSKTWTTSSWLLLAVIFAIILSVLFNQDVAIEGYTPLTRTKYYLFGLLGIMPVQFYFNSLENKDEKVKKISWLLYALIGVATLASLSGMSAVFFGYNVLKFKSGFVERNGGLAGMLMNYAHNLAFFMVFLTGLIIHRSQVQKYINLRFLYFAWIINFLGLYTTYTRGVLLAFFVAIPFYLLKKNAKLFIISSMVLAIVGFTAYKVAGKSMVRPLSDIERISQWKAAYAGFKERPLLGLGFMNFEKLVIPLKKKYGIEAQHFGGHAHSNYFEMLASTGIIGFSFFIFWHATWFVELFKRNDLVADIALPLIIVFIVGGLSQATFTLGANLFLIMSLYTITQASRPAPRIK